MDNELSIVSKMNLDFYIFWVDHSFFLFDFGHMCGILEADLNLSDDLF